jgi:hypothetical protein
MYRNPWRALQMRLIGFGIIMPKNMWKVNPVTMNAAGRLH